MQSINRISAHEVSEPITGSHTLETMNMSMIRAAKAVYGQRYADVLQANIEAGKPFLAAMRVAARESGVIPEGPSEAQD